MKKSILLYSVAFSIAAVGVSRLSFHKYSAQRIPAEAEESENANRWPQSTGQSFKSKLLSKLNSDPRYVQRFPAAISRIQITECTIEQAQKKMSPEDFKNLTRNHHSAAAATFSECAKIAYKSRPHASQRRQKTKTKAASSSVKASENSPWNAESEDTAYQDALKNINTHPTLPQFLDEKSKQDLAVCVVNEGKKSFSPVAFSASTQIHEGMIAQWLGQCATSLEISLENSGQRAISSVTE